LNSEPLDPQPETRQLLLLLLRSQILVINKKCGYSLSLLQRKLPQEYLFWRVLIFWRLARDFIWRVRIFLNFGGYLFWRITEKTRKI